MYINFLNHNDFKIELKNSIIDIENFFNVKSSDLLFKDNSVTSNLVQRYTFFKNGDIHNRIIKPLLLDAAMRSEYISGGAGDICLKISSNMISNMPDLDVSILDIEKLILKNCKRASRSDFYNLIEKNISLDSHKDIFLFLFEKMNISSPVFIERSKLSKTRIVLDSGFNFDISVDKKYITSKTKKMSNVRCFVIDGFIESVSEIHHLLEDASKTKENYIIFSRHMAEDVQSTISYNIQRGTINLIPVSVGFDENTLNILNDISICTNSDLISSHKGDLISQAIRMPPSIIDSIEFGKNSLTIINKHPSKLLKSHVKYLRDKRAISVKPSIFNIIEGRIKSLSSGKIIVSVGADLILKEPKTIEMFDKILREIKSIIKSGVIYLSDIPKSESVISLPLESDYPYSPLSLIVALRNSQSVYNNLKSVHGVIYEDIRNT
jgi:hypothetical protein